MKGEKEKMRQLEAPGKSAITALDRLKVICGANVVELDDMTGFTINEVRRQLRETLNIGSDHELVYLNGQQVHDENIALNGSEELEFKKPAGQKG